MLRDPELAALLDQAERNLETLLLLAYSAGETEVGPLEQMRERLAAVKEAYTRETNALNRAVLSREVERRVRADRRRPQMQQA